MSRQHSPTIDRQSDKKQWKICITFIDYSTAFDSIGHKFLDRSLEAAGASRKTRAIFRAIYEAAVGVVRVRGLKDKTIYSEHFAVVRHDVIQGDIISPIFFVLTMEQIFRLHDTSGDGVDMGNHLCIGVLGYTDDVTIISRCPETMTKRVSMVSRGLREDGDMTISIPKTKVMHVVRQEKIVPPTISEMEATEANTHKCKLCPRRCKTAGGLAKHMRYCNFQ